MWRKSGKFAAKSTADNRALQPSALSNVSDDTAKGFISVWVVCQGQI